MGKGVAGVYMDEARCNGMLSYLMELRSRHPDAFVVLEGLQDRLALYGSTIPTVKLGHPWVTPQNSMLLQWLLPDVTAYAGPIDEGLSGNETAK